MNEGQKEWRKEWMDGWMNEGGMNEWRKKANDSSEGKKKECYLLYLKNFEWVFSKSYLYLIQYFNQQINQ